MENGKFTCPKCGYTWTPRVYPPNWCPKCRRSISEKAKKAIIEINRRCLLKKIKDVQKFESMWQAKVPGREIAKEFNIKPIQVYLIRLALGLPPRPRGGSGNWLRYYIKKKAEENEKAVIDFLKECGGYCELQTLYARFPIGAIKRLLHKKLIFRIAFNLGRTHGSYKRGVHKDVFNESVVGKTFICVDRTAVVRLMCKALKKPKDANIQKTTTAFLRRYLTEAEKFAVLWKLGVRRFNRSQVKRSIQIDGIIKPTLGKLGGEEWGKLSAAAVDEKATEELLE